MELPPVYNSKETEDKIYQKWLDFGFFNPDNLPKKNKKSYVIMIAPPNVTGSLHMGHALENTISDILARMRRMKGYKTLWMPGTDHAGIATQNVVEKELRKEGISRFELGREKFIEQVWRWKEKYGNIILDQLKKLGASCDWSRARFTMDANYAKAVGEAFLHYHKKGWIYRGERVVSWCPRCGTSLSDLELEHEEIKEQLWYLKYKVKDGDAAHENIVVATTRPETMFGDTAVSVNPRDARYKDLIGKKVILPLQNREVPIIADPAVDKDFGTGAIKVTPAHDLVDWEIGLRHNLEKIKIIDERGVMTKESNICEGLKTLECRQKVLEELQKQNLIGKTEDYAHAVPHCYRCHARIEPIPSKQWFLKMEELAKIAIQAVKNGKVKFHPKQWKKIYFNWLKNIRDWCISRQIWWGHRLPVWFHEPKCVPLPGREKDMQKCEDIIVATKEPKCKYCNAKYIQSDDVLDTWFSSALWPFATLGWPQKTRDLKTFYPTNFLTSAREIINLWVARMIFSGFEFMQKPPFKDYYIHATVLTKEGKRMSKSLGTGIDPLQLIEKYGADATRFGLAWQIFGNQDVRFSEEAMLMGKKFCNKIWNASRFVLQQVSNSNLKAQISKPQLKNKNLTTADKKILKALDKIIKSTDKDLENFQFGKAANNLYNFFWHDFCDKYIEQSKPQIQSPKSKIQKENTQKILLYVLLTSLKLLHPFMPFVTEEIYQIMPNKTKKALIIEDWPK